MFLVQQVRGTLPLYPLVQLSLAWQAACHPMEDIAVSLHTVAMEEWEDMVDTARTVAMDQAMDMVVMEDTTEWDMVIIMTKTA